MRFNSKTIVGFVALVLLPEYSICQNTLRPPKRFTEYLDSGVARAFSEVDAQGNCNVDVEALISGWQMSTTGFWNAITSADITCYKQPNDQGGYLASIPFGTGLAVVELQGSWIRVRFDGQNGITEGWVEPCGILLWNKPLAREGGGFPKRRVVLSSLEGANVQLSIEQRYYSGPSKRATKRFAVKGQDVLYVMKEAIVGGQPWSLLCSTANSNDLRVDLEGWLPNSSLTDWDTRVAYWENNSPAAVSEYGNKPIPLFYSRGALRDFENSGYVKMKDTLQAPVLLDSQTPLNRMLHLEASSNEVSTDLELFSVVLPKKTPSGLTPVEVRDLLEVYYNRMQSLQIHFVIDATASMDKNKLAVTEGLEGFWEELNANQLKAYRDTDVKVGCSVYRDALDDGDPGDLGFDRRKGAYYEIIRPTKIDSDSALQKFKAALDSNMFFVSSDPDKTLEEAYYHGITKSIKDAHFQSGATNFLIIIGDAGDAGVEVRNQLLNKKHVLEKLQDANVDVCFLQSTNGYHRAFDQFTSDAMFWASNIENADGPLTRQADIQDHDGWNLIQPGKGEDENVFLNKAQVYLNSDVREEMEEDILGKLVAKEITGAMSLANKRLQSFTDALKGGPILLGPIVGPDGDTVRIEDLELRARSIRAFGKKDYYNANSQGLHNRSAFKPYVYLEYEVYNQLKRDIKKLEGKNATKFFAQLEKFMKQYAAEILGIGSAASGTLIGNLTMGEVWSEAFNVPFNYDLLAGVTLDDLSELGDDNRKKMEREIKKFKQACSDFVNIQVSQYRFKTSINSGNSGGVVYWIPGDQFPGMAE